MSAEPSTPPVAADSIEEVPRAADGRVPGRRGRATRQKLLNCTTQLLADHSYRDLRVVDIARAAGCSPATFYQYFPDVTEAIVTLAEEMAEEGSERLVSLVTRGPWRGVEGFRTAQEIASGFIGFWERYWPLMRVIELTAAEGDERFRSIRIALLHEFTRALADVLAAEQTQGRQSADLDPMATASVLVSMLAHVAAHRYGFESFGMSTEQLEASMAHIVWTTITGQKPPSSRRGADSTA